MLPARISASTTASAERDTSPSTEIFPLSCPSILRDPADDKVPLKRAPRPTTEISDAVLALSIGSSGAFDHYPTRAHTPQSFEAEGERDEPRTAAKPGQGAKADGRRAGHHTPRSQAAAHYSSPTGRT